MRALVVAALVVALVGAAHARGSESSHEAQKAVESGSVMNAIMALEGSANGTNTTGTGYIATKSNNAAFSEQRCWGWP